MKIPYSHPVRKICKIFCPHCHSTRFHRHGSYTRYWFHMMQWGTDQTRKVQRYLCRNKSCPRKTFTVQSPDALPYCRFLFRDLLAVDNALRSGKSVYFVSRTTHLRRSVVRRARRLLQRTRDFLQALCRESDVYDCTVLELSKLIETVQIRYCWIECRALWYRYIYRTGTYLPVIPQNKASPVC
jgi:hypothetical protein